MITKEVDLMNNADQLTEVIRKSFITVAEEFDITEENAPTNPAFIKKDDFIKRARAKNIKYYGYFEENRLTGCYALEKSLNGIFYLERLAVIPEARHRGIGKKLVLDSFQRIKKRGGSKVSIGVIDQHVVLKEWYKSLGFIEKKRKIIPHLPFDVCFMEYKL